MLKAATKAAALKRRTNPVAFIMTILPGPAAIEYVLPLAVLFKRRSAACWWLRRRCYLHVAQRGRGMQPTSNRSMRSWRPTGVPDKVFTLITAEWPPGATTGRHTHPGDEYGTVVEGTLVTRQDGGEWKTLEAGQSYYVPAGVVHETRNTSEKPARSYNGFIVDKGKPRATPAP
jgi:quercetin dioxygenase-like cupin family protein